MPHNKDFAIRIEILNECLRNTRKKWTLQNLIDAVNNRLFEKLGKTVSRKTIQDDLKYMKEDLSEPAPIEKRKEGTTTYFYYSDPNYSTRNLPISGEEIDLLKDAIHLLRQVDNFKILTDLDAIINKLQNTVTTNVEGGSTIVQFEKHTTALGTEYIDQIFEAIKGESALRIKYQSFKTAVASQCVFHPYLLKEFRNRWFVVGRNEKGTSVTILALDRIKELKNSSDEYINNDLFNPETYYNNLIGVSIPDGEQIQFIELRIASNQVPYIRTKPIHHTQELIKEYKNGDVKVKLSLINNYELRSVLLSYGCDVEVLQPEILRNEMKEIFQKGANLYQ